MHEFSIAEALAAQVIRHAPARGRVSEVEIRVGALRGLEPEAMNMSWDAVTFDTPLAGSVLLMDMRPWTLTCPACGRVWESPVPFAGCTCGETAPRPTAGDELDLISMTVDEDDDADASAEAPGAEPAEPAEPKEASAR
ncbi:MAG TPA: hydrogenase maturation nickel metallochaperone HypA [Candidatus Limnocylindrales bacterium]